MERVILIKYGEMTTKKGNRNFFVNTLYNNVKDKLKKFDVKIVKEISRMYIEFHDEDLESIKQKINTIFGIHTYHIAYIINSNMDEIASKSVEIMNKQQGKTFKVETKRSDKNFPIKSMDISRQIGGAILKNVKNMKVDVVSPEILLSIEVRPYKSYIYTKTYYGLGGYPVGTQAKGMLMLSGGIDSPVAGYLALKRGVALDAVYFEAIPHTSIEARNKVIELSKKLSKYTNKINLHVVPFTEIQEAIYKTIDPTYCITIMRRMMYRITDKLAKKHNALIIVNGESIGQVASQTLTSMSVINQVTTMPVIRPVACLDKLEIIDIAKKIDSYETSILPYEDCCTIFVPRHPVINPTLEKAISYEKNFEFERMIEEAIEKTFTIQVKELEEDKFKELL